MADVYVLKLNPEPWAIGKTFAYRGRGGAGIAPDRKLVSFQQAVREAITTDYPEAKPTKEPVKITFYFSRAIESLSYGGKRGAYANYADATNLQKGLEDALQGIIIENDNQVKIVTSVIMDQKRDADPFVIIILEKDFTLPWGRVERLMGKYSPTEAKFDNNEW